MVDWIAITTAAVNILVPYVKKAGEKAAEKAGEAIFTLIKDKVQGDAEAKSTLANFEKNPDRHATALADILREQAENDPEFGAALKKLVEESDKQAVGSVTQIASGTGIAQASGTGTSASVSMGSKEDTPNDSK